MSMNIGPTLLQFFAGHHPDRLESTCNTYHKSLLPQVEVSSPEIHCMLISASAAGLWYTLLKKGLLHCSHLVLAAVLLFLMPLSYSPVLLPTVLFLQLFMPSRLLYF